MERRAGRPPGSNGGYWGPKLARNVERDAKAFASLTQNGWNVLVIWECETKDAAILEKRLRDFLEAGMPKRKEPEMTPQGQYERFKEAARELECDDDEGRFRDRLKKLTEAPAPETVEPKKAAAAKPRKKKT